MEVFCSDNLRAMLADETARRELVAAVAMSARERRANPPKVTLGANTYTVFFGLECGKHKREGGDG